jgi:uncharacterized HhH-GPD family protein
MTGTLHLAQDPAADELLSDNPLALLIGMVLDQQIPLEWAFKGPLMLQERIGDLDAADIAGRDPDALAKVFAERPAQHRYPGSKAKREHELCTRIVEKYDGDPAAVWTTAPTGEQLYKGIRNLPGFGEQKARIFVALLAKQLGVQPRGWQKAAGEYGKKGSYMSVADIVDESSLGRVRQYKQAKKAAAKAAGGAAEARVAAPKE